MSERADVVSSFTIIKGALVSETYEAFRHWDFTEDRAANIARLKEVNIVTVHEVASSAGGT